MKLFLNLELKGWICLFSLQLSVFWTLLLGWEGVEVRQKLAQQRAELKELSNVDGLVINWVLSNTQVSGWKNFQMKHNPVCFARWGWSSLSWQLLRSTIQLSYMPKNKRGFPLLVFWSTPSSAEIFPGGSNVKLAPWPQLRSASPFLFDLFKIYLSNFICREVQEKKAKLAP